MERRKKGLPRVAGGKRRRKGAPAGAGVIVDIQRGKYAISRPHKSGQSDEPPCAARGGPFPPRCAWQQRYLCAGSRLQVGQHYARVQHHVHACTPTRKGSDASGLFIRECRGGVPVSIVPEFRLGEKSLDRRNNATPSARYPAHTTTPWSRVVGQIYDIAETGERNSKRVGFLPGPNWSTSRMDRRRNASMSNI